MEGRGQNGILVPLKFHEEATVELTLVTTSASEVIWTSTRGYTGDRRAGATIETDVRKTRFFRNIAED